MPSPLGLKVVLDRRGKPRHSVRGVVVHRKHLYVADEAGDAVKVFNVQSGELMAHITGRALIAPVHLVLHGETLYIGASGTGSILALDLTSTSPKGELKAHVVIDGKLDSPSGFAVGPDSDLYVAERKKQRVRRFSSKGKKRGRSLMIFRTCRSSSSMFPEKSQGGYILSSSFNDADDGTDLWKTPFALPI